MPFSQCARFKEFLFATRKRSLHDDIINDKPASMSNACVFVEELEARKNSDSTNSAELLQTSSSSGQNIATDVERKKMAGGPESLAQRIELARLRCHAVRSDIGDLNLRCDRLQADLLSLQQQLIHNSFKRYTLAPVTSGKGDGMVLENNNTASPVLPQVNNNRALMAATLLDLTSRDTSKRFDGLRAPNINNNENVFHFHDKTADQRNKTEAEKTEIKTAIGQDSADNLNTLVGFRDPCSENTAASSPVQKIAIVNNVGVGHEQPVRKGHILCDKTSVGSLDAFFATNINECHSDNSSQEISVESDTHLYATPRCLSRRSYESDLNTPAIQALTCLESLSGSGRLFNFLTSPSGYSKQGLDLSGPRFVTPDSKSTPCKTAAVTDPQAVRSSAMLVTPPDSDNSVDPDDKKAECYESYCHLRLSRPSSEREEPVQSPKWTEGSDEEATESKSISVRKGIRMEDEIPGADSEEDAFFEEEPDRKEHFFMAQENVLLSSYLGSPFSPIPDRESVKEYREKQNLLNFDNADLSLHVDVAVDFKKTAMDSDRRGDYTPEGTCLGSSKSYTCIFQKFLTSQDEKSPLKKTDQKDSFRNFSCNIDNESNCITDQISSILSVKALQNSVVNLNNQGLHIITPCIPDSESCSANICHNRLQPGSASRTGPSKMDMPEQMCKPVSALCRLRNSKDFVSLPSKSTVLKQYANLTNNDLHDNLQLKGFKQSGLKSRNCIVRRAGAAANAEVCKMASAEVVSPAIQGRIAASEDRVVDCNPTDSVKKTVVKHIKMSKAKTALKTDSDVSTFGWQRKDNPVDEKTVGFAQQSLVQTETFSCDPVKLMSEKGVTDTQGSPKATECLVNSNFANCVKDGRVQSEQCTVLGSKSESAPMISFCSITQNEATCLDRNEVIQHMGRCFRKRLNQKSSSMKPDVTTEKGVSQQQMGRQFEERVKRFPSSHPCRPRLKKSKLAMKVEKLRLRQNSDRDAVTTQPDASVDKSGKTGITESDCLANTENDKKIKNAETMQCSSANFPKDLLDTENAPMHEHTLKAKNSGISSIQSYNGLEGLSCNLNYLRTDPSRLQSSHQRCQQKLKVVSSIKIRVRNMSRASHMPASQSGSANNSADEGKQKSEGDCGDVVKNAVTGNELQDCVQTGPTAHEGAADGSLCQSTTGSTVPQMLTLLCNDANRGVPSMSKNRFKPSEVTYSIVKSPRRQLSSIPEDSCEELTDEDAKNKKAAMKHDLTCTSLNNSKNSKSLNDFNKAESLKTVDSCIENSRPHIAGFHKPTIEETWEMLICGQLQSNDQSGKQVLPTPKVSDLRQVDLAGTSLASDETVFIVEDKTDLNCTKKPSGCENEQAESNFSSGNRSKECLGTLKDFDSKLSAESSEMRSDCIQSPIAARSTQYSVLLTSTPVALLRKGSLSAKSIVFQPFFGHSRLPDDLSFVDVSEDIQLFSFCSEIQPVSSTVLHFEGLDDDDNEDSEVEVFKKNADECNSYEVKQKNSKIETVTVKDREEAYGHDDFGQCKDVINCIRDYSHLLETRPIDSVPEEDKLPATENHTEILHQVSENKISLQKVIENKAVEDMLTMVSFCGENTAERDGVQSERLAPELPEPIPQQAAQGTPLQGASLVQLLQTGFEENNDKTEKYSGKLHSKPKHRVTCIEVLECEKLSPPVRVSACAETKLPTDAPPTAVMAQNTKPHAKALLPTPLYRRMPWQQCVYGPLCMYPRQDIDGGMPDGPPLPACHPVAVPERMSRYIWPLHLQAFMPPTPWLCPLPVKTSMFDKSVGYPSARDVWQLQTKWFTGRGVPYNGPVTWESGFGSWDPCAPYHPFPSHRSVPPAAQRPVFVDKHLQTAPASCEQSTSMSQSFLKTYS